MNGAITFDTAALERGVRQLADGLERSTSREGMAEARTTADRIRARVPRRSGRLAATVMAVPDPDGGAVRYGGGLPYAAYIEKRSHAVSSGLAGAAERFHQAATDVARREIGRL